MLLDTFGPFDRLGRDLFSIAGGAIGAPVDVRREDDRYVVDADLLGVDPREVKVSVEGDTLTIRAARSEES